MAGLKISTTSLYSNNLLSKVKDNTHTQRERESKIKGISLFSGVGVSNAYLKDIGIEIVAANELLEKRAEFYKHLYPKSNMIIGDIRDEKVFKQILTFAIKEKVQLLLITPPCQGFSLIGKNKNEEQILADESNFLIFKAIELIEKCDFDYILIENVPRFLTVSFPYKSAFKSLTEILVDKFSNEYHIEGNILNARDYGVPQNRPRAIVKLYKKKYSWS
ncbi:13531_t:CDS:1 [Funneliformis geosporum]|uniref:13531_t:CDS:1 n=1 Tax=Funneliformis geosporum TaxID=1117311 RepID=A0A9W4WTE6_9GLOM|nr:13531_t:CDS:1 [Funneliformis geosporum]